jgi:hypothetical protein
MATTVTVTSNYAGKEAGAIVGQAFKEADTIQKGFVTTFENINFKLNLRKIELTGGKRSYSCGHVPAGAITLSEKVLEPKKFKDDFEVCKEDFRAQWSEESMGASAHNDNAPKDIMDAILVEKLAQTAQETDSNIWNGDSANDDEFDGFLKLFAADADVIDVDLAAATTEANVEAQLKQVLSAVPVALRRKELKVGVSSDVAQAYNFYLISKGISNGLGGDANTLPRFGRYVIEELNGLPDSTYVVAEPKNLIFGTGLLADHNEVRLVDQDETMLNGKVIGTMVYNAGVQYYNGEEIVWARQIA